jgi:hypothetical protein
MHMPCMYIECQEFIYMECQECIYIECQECIYVECQRIIEYRSHGTLCPVSQGGNDLPTHAKLVMGVAIIYTTHYITCLHAYACAHWPVYERQRNKIIIIIIII